MTRSPLHSLLRSLRRRLWLERGLRRLRTAAWAGSLTLLALACYSMFFAPVSPTRAVAVALVAFLVVTATVVFLRPSLHICAHRGDRLFDTSSLLLSALEVKRKDEDSPAGRVVVRQANSAAPLFRRRLGDAWVAPALSGFALTLVPLFASMVLLSYTTVESSGIAEPDAAASSLHAIEYELDNDDDLVELRNTMAEGPVRQDQRPSETVTELAPNTGEVSDDIMANESATAVSATAPGHGREAGDSQSDPGAAGLELDPAGTASLTAVSISRRGDAIGTEGGGEFAPAVTASRIVDVVPAAAPTSLSDWSALSPAQVAYARRYLDRMEAGND